MVSSRNAVANVRSGEARTDFTNVAAVKMDYSIRANSVTGNIIEETTNPLKDTIHAKSPIALLVELRKSVVAGAGNGSL